MVTKGDKGQRRQMNPVEVSHTNAQHLQHIEYL